MQRSLIRNIAASLVLLFMFSKNIPAGRPPWAYTDQQENAPEYLNVQCLSVKVTPLPEKYKRTDPLPPIKSEMTVEAQLKVLDAYRSQSGLKAGDIIDVVYLRTTFTPPIVGPRDMPLLKKDGVYPAYLKKDDNHFSLAADEWSFETVPIEDSDFSGRYRGSYQSQENNSFPSGCWLELSVKDKKNNFIFATADAGRASATPEYYNGTFVVTGDTLELHAVQRYWADDEWGHQIKKVLNPTDTVFQLKIIKKGKSIELLTSYPNNMGLKKLSNE